MSASFLETVAKFVHRAALASHIPSLFTGESATACVARTLVDAQGAQKMGFLTGMGDGGAVTQITSAATGVTLNKVTGQITTVALSTAAAAETIFTVTNSKVAAKDVVAVCLSTYAGGGTPIVTVKNVVAGAFDIVITNLHASAALDALVVINFVVIKTSIN